MSSLSLVPLGLMSSPMWRIRQFTRSVTRPLYDYAP